MYNYLSDVEALIRKSLSEENEAVSVYETRANIANQYADDVRESDPNLAEKLENVSYIINDIKKEEEVHIGELQALLQEIDVSNKEELEGKEEVQQKIKSESFVEIGNKLKRIL